MGINKKPTRSRKLPQILDSKKPLDSGMSSGFYKINLAKELIMQQNIMRVKPALPMPAITLASITGSALLKPLLRAKPASTSILCAVSNDSDLDALLELHLVYIAASNAKYFVSELGIPYRHAVAVNGKGNPLTSQQIVRLI